MQSPPRTPLKGILPKRASSSSYSDLTSPVRQAKQELNIAAFTDHLKNIFHRDMHNQVDQVVLSKLNKFADEVLKQNIPGAMQVFVELAAFIDLNYQNCPIHLRLQLNRNVISEADPVVTSILFKIEPATANPAETTFPEFIITPDNSHLIISHYLDKLDYGNVVHHQDYFKGVCLSALTLQDRQKFVSLFFELSRKIEIHMNAVSMLQELNSDFKIDNISEDKKRITLSFGDWKKSFKLISNIESEAETAKLAAGKSTETDPTKISDQMLELGRKYGETGKFTYIIYPTHFEVVTTINNQPYVDDQKIVSPSDGSTQIVKVYYNYTIPIENFAKLAKFATGFEVNSSATDTLLYKNANLSQILPEKWHDIIYALDRITSTIKFIRDPGLTRLREAFKDTPELLTIEMAENGVEPKRIEFPGFIWTK